MFFCASCGSAESDNKMNEENTLIEQNEVASSDSLIENLIDDQNESEQWQIDDYVEFFLGEEVSKSAEDIDWNDGKMHWYYEELDVSGGYANITGAVEGWQEFVLYRLENGQDLVLTKSVGCGPACDYHHVFYQGEGEEVREIQMSEVLPMNELDVQITKLQSLALKDDAYPIDYPEDHQIDCIFPKKGTQLKIDLVLGADERRMALADLSWNRIEFSVEKVYETIIER